MARKKVGSNVTTEPTKLVVPVEDAASKIQQQIDKGKALHEERLGSSQELDESEKSYRRWDEYNKELLKQVFNTPAESDDYAHYAGSFTVISAFSSGPSVGDSIKEHKEDIEEKIHRLESLHDKLELIPSIQIAHSPALPSAQKKQLGKKVFVVHGHDQVSKTNLELFLKEIGLDPIVLHRQADEGQTIIEKFEKHSDVGYAFILLTPDEVAYLRQDDEKDDNERSKELRARPNVIFEFGYFVGKLGRSKVCCLHTGGVALPSDVSGIIYKSYQNSIEETAYSIIKDLKAAGYSVNIA